MKTFVTSDTHFNHKNICRGVSNWDHERAKGSVRDFDNLSEMNQELLFNINNVIQEDDILYHLGDWSFGGFEYIKIFRDMIICKNIHLILGNHDHHISKDKDGIRSAFSSVNQTLKVEIEGHNFIMSHYPICSWENMNKEHIHLFGHVHLPPIHKIRQGKAMDVGVDGNNFKPYEIGEIINIMSKQPISSISLPIDHHNKDFKS